MILWISPWEELDAMSASTFKLYKQLKAGFLFHFKSQFFQDIVQVTLYFF